MKKIIFQISMFLLLLTTLISCKDNNSPDNESNSGDIFKVTASDGTTKTFVSDTQLLKGVNVFSNFIQEPSSSDNTYYLILTGFSSAGESCFEFGGVSSIQLGKVYTYVYKNKPVSGEAVIQLYDWIDEDFGGIGSTGKSVKVTAQFSKFQYPGQIKGIVINYDINDNVVAKGEFDFISIKSSI